MATSHPAPERHRGKAITPWPWAALCAVAWGAAPWLDDGGGLALVGAIGWAVVGLRNAWMAAGLGVVVAAVQLAWLPAVWRDAGQDGAVALTALVVGLQALPMLLAAAVVARSRRRCGPIVAVTLAWMVAEGVAAAVQPLPALHAVWLADTSMWLWPAAWVGRVGLTGLTAGWGALAGHRPMVAVVVLAGWGAVGWLPGPSGGASLDVAVFQPDVHVQDARIPRFHEARAEAIVAVANGLDVDLLVLPEGAWPFDPGEPDSTRRMRFTEHLADAGPMVIGATVGTPPGATNSALFVVDGEVGAVVDKQVLVPVWERRFLGLGRDRYRAGTGPSTFLLGANRVGVLLCYEDLFEHRLRDVSDAHLLVLPTNDSWLGAVGKRVHLGTARLAAASLRRPTLRASLDGTSALLAHDERLLATPSVGWPTRPGRTLEATITPSAVWAPGVHLSRWLALGAWIVVLVGGRR